MPEITDEDLTAADAALEADLRELADADVDLDELRTFVAAEAEATNEIYLDCGGI
jgi:hypothetical protein